MAFRDRAVRLFVVFVIAMMTSCFPNRSRAAIPGEYELKAAGERITLKVAPNERFEETVYSSSGKAVSIEGRWQWYQGAASFVGLIIPEELTAEYIDQTESWHGTRQPHNPITAWSFIPEDHWGTLVLPVFPDSDIEFRKVSR